MSKAKRFKRRNQRKLIHESALQICFADPARPPEVRTRKADDVGFDLEASEDTVIPAGAHLPPTEVPLGLSIKLPKGTWATLWPRSSQYGNYPSLRLCNAPIDGGYTGPLTARFQNIGLEPILVKRGTRLVQLVLFGRIVPQVVLVKELPKTERGSSKYGSTGK